MRLVTSFFALALAVPLAARADTMYTVTNGVGTHGVSFSGTFTISAAATFSGGSFKILGDGFDGTYTFNRDNSGTGRVGGEFELGSDFLHFYVSPTDYTVACTSGSPCNGTNGSLLDADGIGASFVTAATIMAAPPVAVTPEPSSLALLGTGILGMAAVMRRRLKQA